MTFLPYDLARLSGEPGLFLVARYAHHRAAMLAAEIMERMPQSHALRGDFLRRFHFVRVEPVAHGASVQRVAFFVNFAKPSGHRLSDVVDGNSADLGFSLVPR